MNNQNFEIPEIQENATKLIIHEPLENTPFHITGNEEKGYFLRLGDYRITDYIKLKDKSIDVIKNIMYEHLAVEQWNITTTIIAAIMHAQKNNKSQIEIEK